MGRRYSVKRFDSNDEREAYENLAFAIVETACVDYMNMRKNNSHITYAQGTRVMMYQVENFFKSNWCNTLLCKINMTGEEVLDVLNERCGG